MKRVTIAATLLAAAFLIFLFVRSSSPHSPAVFNIKGEWKLDSMYPLQASADSNSHLSYPAWAAIAGKTTLEFNADSSFSIPGATDNVHENYYVKDSVLYINENKSYVPYHIQMQTDSVIRLISRDSTVFVLKKP